MLANLLLLAIALTVSLEVAGQNVERRDTYTTSKPVVNSIALYNTVKQTKIGHITDGQKIDICSLRSAGIHSPSQLAFRAWTANTESVDFTFNNKFYRRESYAPFTLCGDSGEGSYEGCTDLKYGHQCISAKPYSKTDGKGTAGKTLKVCFDVVGCPAPIKPPVRAPVPVPVLPPPSVTSFDLINTVKQNTIRTLKDGERIDICKLSSVGIHEPSQLNFRAVTAGHVESVQFTKNSVFFRNDNAAFYSLCGDNSGFPYYGCADLALGYQCITAKPCTKDNAAGVCGAAKQICFTIVGCPAPTKAPVKPPTKAPVRAPTVAPVSAPTRKPRTSAPVNAPTTAPIKPPTKAPVRPPTKAPVRAPTVAPVSAPTRKPRTSAPVNAPTTAPIKPPTKAPVTPPTKAPIKAPTKAPVKAPTKAPVGHPTRKPRTSAPVNAPTKAPINAPTKAPVKPPTKAPVKPPTMAPVKPPVRAPVAAPVMPPVRAPITAPVMPPVRAPVAAPVMPPTMPTATCSSQALGAASTYNMFISGDLSGLHDSQGDVAVGGNADFRSSGFSIKGNAVVGGDLFANSGKIDGKLTIGGTKYAGDSLTIVGGVHTGKPIDFGKEKARLQLLSKTYATYQSTGTTTNYYGEIRLDGTKSGLNVFTVDASVLGKANGVKITVPHGATVLINVTGAYVTMQNFAIWVNGTSRTNVLWNMPSAHSLHMTAISIQGSILAPNAAVTFNNGNFEGTIVGHSWTGNGEGHNFIFTGCLPIIH